jgi:hypothetical protein
MPPTVIGLLPPPENRPCPPDRYLIGGCCVFDSRPVPISLLLTPLVTEDLSNPKQQELSARGVLQTVGPTPIPASTWAVIAP